MVLNWNAIIIAALWPAVVLIVGLLLILVCRNQIREVVSRVRRAEFQPAKGQFTFEVFEKAATLVTQAVEAADLPAGQPSTAEVRETVRASVSQTGYGPVSGAVLWVDDRPSNNTKLVQAFETLGIDVTIAASTTEAMSVLTKSRFNFIVSDMSRPPDKTAGYTLLTELRAKNISTPVLIYAGFSAPTLNAEAVSKGAVGSTNRPDEVFRIVTQALRGVPFGGVNLASD